VRAGLTLSADVLGIDCGLEAQRIADALALAVRKLHRRGLVIAMSGGVDSSVCAALAAKALGAGRVYGLLLPEHESNSMSERRARLVAEQLKVPYDVEHIGAALEALGCYRHRDEAIKRLFPDYGPGWKSKIAIAGSGGGGLTFFKLVIQSPQGAVQERRLPVREYLEIVAATSLKQRLRKTLEYFHADRLNFAVMGTPNRLEYDQGFFVKNGDGAADVKPIAHLYKTQVYALARHLALPEEVCTATPTTDTYSMEQSQDEFYFPLRYDRMDMALWALNHGMPAGTLAEYLGTDEAHAAFIYEDIKRKRQATAYLHTPPLLVEPVSEISYAPR
jgi:NAD+ synthase